MNTNIKKLDYSMNCINKKINFCIEYPYIQPVEVIDSKSNIIMSDNEYSKTYDDNIDKIYLVL